MKTYTKHNCDAVHRTPQAFIRCAIPRAEWIIGNGTYAVIAWCRVPTVSLWETVAEAECALRLINNGACGGQCNPVRHEIVEIRR